MTNNVSLLFASLNFVFPLHHIMWMHLGVLKSQVDLTLFENVSNFDHVTEQNGILDSFREILNETDENDDNVNVGELARRIRILAHMQLRVLKGLSPFVTEQTEFRENIISVR